MASAAVNAHEPSCESVSLGRDGSGVISHQSSGILSGGPGSPDLISNQTMLFLSPTFDDPSRTSSLAASTFNLVCTIMGGASLSFPWAFARIGLIPGMALILIWALFTDFSLYLLLLCCRHNGCVTFEAVAQNAFGSKMRRLVTFLLFLLCWMSSIAYFVLVGAVSISVAKALSGGSMEITETTRRIAMSIMAVLVLPRCCVSKLNTLRFTSILSICSFLILFIAISTRAVQRLMSPTPLTIQWGPTDWQNLPYTMSLYSAAFVCHFNILPVHMELERPTRRRITLVLHGTLAFCSLMFLSIGTFGYIYGGRHSCDNILSNFCHTDHLINTGRCALILVLFSNFPLIAIPARNCLDRLVRPEEDEYAPLPSETEIEGNEPSQAVPGFPTRRVSEASFVVGTSLLAACFIPGVSSVWTLVGSTVCVVVAFILPSAFFLKLRPQGHWKGRRLLAVLLIVFASVVGLLSSYEAVKNMGAQACASDFDPCSPS